MLSRVYRHTQARPRDREECFYIEHFREFTTREVAHLHWLLTGPFHVVGTRPRFHDEDVVEIGPRLSVETPFSSNAVAICKSLGLPISRIEMSTRFLCTPSARKNIVATHLDPMTQEIYETQPESLDPGFAPESVRFADILGLGEQALRSANKELGLGMDEWDVTHWTNLFRRLDRNPSDAELMQIGNGNSEHSRHWFFRGIQIIDGVERAETLMDIVRAPWIQSPGNSLVAFHDNAGVIRGNEVLAFMPTFPGMPSSFMTCNVLQHLTATAETHNHPTLKAPFQGATTGLGGMERDKFAQGRGANQRGASIAGYAVGNIHIPRYEIPGEIIGGEKHRADATPLEILIQASNGVSDYGNKLGVPLIAGFCRTFGQMVSNLRSEFRKPVLYCGGISRVFDAHFKKRSPEAGMLIVRMGGPAYRIGVGGGSASSMISGTNTDTLDLKSVQRGDAEMENRVNRVIQTCAELLDLNPIESIHDQGAGGPSNVLTELMETLGGKIDIRKITVGDKTMSVLEIWVAEFQESYGLLVRPENIGVLETICKREHVNCDVLGEITGDGNVVVTDSLDNTTPINLPLKDILGDLPRKRFESNRQPKKLRPLKIPADLSVEEALRMIFKLPHVGSKGFLVHKVDRSVTGLIARQQCCGPMQVPVADVAVTADGYFGLTGAATALGEQPIKMLIDPAAGARMAVAEMLTNMCSVKISRLEDIKCRANWMWAAKRPGEGALLYSAAPAMRDIMIKLGIAIDGGKDSLSMATQVGDDLVVSPGELVIMGYAPVLDITKVATPDLKGSGCLGYLRLGSSYRNLGGSALAQALGQIGNVTPDIKTDHDVQNLVNAFNAVQDSIDQGLITAYHDISDGGLITAITEMCIAGNRGASVSLRINTDIFPTLFSEETGMLFEYSPQSRRAITQVMKKHGVFWDSSKNQIATTDHDMGGNLRIFSRRESWINLPVSTLRQWWEATSLELEKRQTNLACVESERKSQADKMAPQYNVSFKPHAPALKQLRAHKVAILREEGINGDREMAAAFYTAGLDAVDISMSDLLEKRVTSFEQFRGLVFPGGFSYADVFGSAKGWAASIRFSPHTQEIFERFYDRSDTFTFSVCNGCQLTTQIGWLPHKGLPEDSEPRLVHNVSGRFEHRWVTVRILESPSILFKGMEGSVLGVNVAHGEGKFLFRDENVAQTIRDEKLVPLVYTNRTGKATEIYPYNPNGSPEGWAALCSRDGRHLAMMPHPERTFLKWQWPWMPENIRDLEASPWLQMFQNAKKWCDTH